MKKILIFLVCFAMAFASDADARRRRKKPKEKVKKVKWVKSKYGLKALMELSSGRDKMIKDLNRETQNYERALKAIDNGKVASGDSTEVILKQIGEPVITRDREDPSRVEWLYKPAYVDYSSKEKLYLIFDKDGILVDWRVPREETV